MDFPWTVLLETPEGDVKAQNVMAPANPNDALVRMEDTFVGFRVLGVVKGSHASIVYGHQVTNQTTHKNQMRIPFEKGGHNP